MFIDKKRELENCKAMVSCEASHIFSNPYKIIGAAKETKQKSSNRMEEKNWVLFHTKKPKLIACQPIS